MSFSDVLIVTVRRNDCRIHFEGVTKSGAMKKMKNAYLSEKKWITMIMKKNELLITVMSN